MIRSQTIYFSVNFLGRILDLIKNFVFIQEGTDLDDFSFEYTGLNYWNFEKRLKLYNLNYNNSEIFFEKDKNNVNNILFTFFSSS